MIETRINEFEEIAKFPSRSVRRLKEQTGKKLIGCFPIYAPEELIYGAGMMPVGMWGGQTEIRFADRYLQSFCCSIMRQNLEQGIKGTYRMLDGVVLPIYCDTLKCVCENWKAAVSGMPLLPVVYPQNRRTLSGLRYLEAELKRVLTELERISGTKCTEQDLQNTFAVYRNCREEQRRFTETARSYPVTITARVRHNIIKASYFMDKQEYAAKLRGLTDCLQSMPEEDFKGSRIVLSGILGEPQELLEIIEQSGIAVAGDDLAQESRQFRTPDADVEASVFSMLARRYARQGGCALLFEEQKTKGQLLCELVKHAEADGVIVCMMKFCDPEEFDYPIYKRELERQGIPLLCIEVEQPMDSMEQLKTRIQGFAEMLQVRKLQKQNGGG